MNIKDDSVPQTHENVMELLVREEIEKQLKFYSSKTKSYINKVEVATYALNRLPPLYASSEKGKNQQKRLGLQKYQKEIVTAVRRAIAAIERDPLRNSTPIVSELDLKWQEAEMALEELQELLQERNLFDSTRQQLSWENLVSVIQRALNKVAWSRKGTQPQSPPRGHQPTSSWLDSPYFQPQQPISSNEENPFR